MKMNHEMATPETPPVLSAGCSEFTPVRKQDSPVRCQPSSAVLYFCGQHRTPLGRVEQLSGKHRIPAGNTSSTPGSASLSGSGSTQAVSMSKTPLSGRTYQRLTGCRNPFEAGLVDTLHRPTFSPNVFKTSTPGSAGSTRFQWSIDDLAVLKPVDIDEQGYHDAWNFGLNSELEERAQKAIDTYFSSQIIVPSPWTDSSKKKPFVLPATPGGASLSDSPMIFTTKSSSNKLSPKLSSRNSESRLVKYSKTDASSQTALTLPVNFDLESILSQHYSCREVGGQDAEADDDDDAKSQEILSNSSLRRKLFFHGDEGTPISPVRYNKNPMRNEIEFNCEGSLSGSPVNSGQIPLCSSGCDAVDSSCIVDLSHIDQFSSSPIKNVHITPIMRRCSTTPLLLMDSPAMSPIRSNDRFSTPNTGSSVGSKAATTAASGDVFCGGMCPSQSPENTASGLPNGSFTITSADRGRKNLSTAFEEDDEMEISCQLLELKTDHVERTDVNKSRCRRTKLLRDGAPLSSPPVDCQFVLLDWHCAGRPATTEDEEEEAENEELPSLCQDPVHDDAVSGAISADTGYQSNFLQTTGTTSNNGTGCCSSAPLDSVPRSLLAEEDMSCDSSAMSPAFRSETTAAFGLCRGVDGDIDRREEWNAAAGRLVPLLSFEGGDVVVKVKGDGMAAMQTTFSLDRLTKTEGHFKMFSTERSQVSELRSDQIRSRSQSDIFYSCSEPLSN